MRGANLPDRRTTEVLRDFGLVKERLDRLVGVRGKVGERSVLREDLSLLTGIGEPKSVKVSSAPTDEEFNALVDDVHAIMRSLRAIAKRLERTG